MSMTFSQATTLPSSPQARAGATLHQKNSWWLAAAPWQVLQRWAERRTQRHALLELADQKHLLADIGLTRAEVLREATRPFWQCKRAVNRARIVGFWAGGLECAIGLAGTAHAGGPQVCRPTLAVSDVKFSAMQPPTMGRTWTAVVAVDASQCAAAAGYFEIGFSRLKENGPEVDFREQFTWQPPSVNVSVDFWADEAVESYWLNTIAACPCRG